MPSPAFKPDDARKLFENLDQIHLVYIHPNGVGVHGKDFATDVDAALDDAAKANANGYNIYWTVNYVRPGLNKKPDKGSITHARFVHVDIDPPKTGGAFNKGEITAALLEIDQPPSFIIDSGGGLQAFWRLEGPCQNLASIEAINTQARDWFEADASQNIDRLMRVPGSVNYPNKAKLARGRTVCLTSWAEMDSELSYEPAELAAGFPPAKESAAAPMVAINVPQGIDLVTPDDLELGALDPIRLAIETPPGADRSGDGLAAARLLANAGRTDVEIMGVLLNPANTVASHFLDQRDPRRAAARAIQLVRQDSPAEGETLHAPIMSVADFTRFVENAKAKVRTVPARLEPEVELRAMCGEPGWMRDLGDGALAQFVAHTVASAPSPQPWATLGAGLAMFGAAAGRRYASPSNLRTNIYSIGIIDSGGGKDHPLRATTRLMITSGLANHVGSSKIASGAGLITAVTRNPSIFFPIDEIGFVVSSAADRKRAPKHLTEIVDNLTEFYSLASHTYLGTAYANDKEKPREVIEQPCLCLFGVTTPAVFWGSLSSDNVVDGSLARMLIFESDNPYPDPQHDLALTDPPQSLIDAMEAISRGAEGSNPFPMGNGAAITPKPYRVPYADERTAMKARDMREMQTELLRKHQGTNVTGIIARLNENAAKIALIKAITDNPADPVLTGADLEWGMSIARRSVDTLMGAVKERVADSAHESDLKRLHKLISDSGSAGIAHEDLAKRARFYRNRKLLSEALDFLSDGGSIRCQEFSRADGVTGARKRKVYFDID
jgi:hypothetical protein